MSRKNQGERRPGIWGKLDRKYLFLTVFSLLVMCGSGYAIMHVSGRYQRGITLLILLLSIYFLFHFAKKLLNEEIQDLIDEIFEKVVGILFWPLAFVVRKIIKVLGIGRWRGWGEDEKTFLSRDRKKEYRKRRLKNEEKWADQLDNKHRVRYLYVEYMIKRIRSGYLLRRQMTPREIAEEMSLDEDEKLLFATYDLARYAESPLIDDETVDAIYKMTARRREIRKD